MKPSIGRLLKNIVDPMKSEKQMVAQGIIINEIDETGKMKLATEKSKRERETKLLNDIKKDNNIIELDLLK
jgi:hypothetical protein